MSFATRTITARELSSVAHDLSTAVESEEQKFHNLKQTRTPKSQKSQDEFFRLGHFKNVPQIGLRIFPHIASVYFKILMTGFCFWQCGFLIFAFRKHRH